MGKEGRKPQEEENNSTTIAPTVSAPESSSLVPSSSVPRPSSLVAIPVLEMSLTVWQEIISEIKKENSTLAALLRDAKPLKLEGDKLYLGVKFKFHKDKINEKKNCAILEKSIESILGKKHIVHCEITDFRPKLSDGTSDNDLQKAAEEIFN